MDERKTAAASALAWQPGGTDPHLRQDHSGRGGSRSSVFSVACQQRTPGAAFDTCDAHLKSVDEALGRHTHRKMSSRKQQRKPLPLEGLSLCKGGGTEDGNFSTGAAPSRGEKKYNPSSLSAVPKAHQAEIQLSMVGALENPVSPELFHDAARRFDSDASRLSSPRGTVCCALNMVCSCLHEHQ